MNADPQLRDWPLGPLLGHHGEIVDRLLRAQAGMGFDVFRLRQSHDLGNLADSSQAPG